MGALPPLLAPQGFSVHSRVRARTKKRPQGKIAALPADALQLIMVPLDPFEAQVKAGAKEPQACAPLAVAEQTDWRAVQKLLR